MKANYLFKVSVLLLSGFLFFQCSSDESDAPDETPDESGEQTQTDMGNAKIILLHHSTGEAIWDGGVAEWFTHYNNANETNYEISETYFPREGYDWSNNPYDYWNIWVNHAGNDLYSNQKTLEILTEEYDVVVWKHCFPVSHIYENEATSDVSSEHPSLENYQLQYNALKEKMRSFPDTRFIVWTGAVELEVNLSEEEAQRTKTFFEWVKNEWDTSGDNIYVWDFYQLETEGDLYLRTEYATDYDDAHPNSVLSERVAPMLSNRIVNVIAGKGDITSITGE